jgi:glycosyltransferase involved in cell wall biosynthesis
MIRVAFVSVSHKPITSESTGGLETFAIYYLNQLKQSDCQITLFAAKETDPSLFPGINLSPLFSLDDIQKAKDEDLESKTFTLNYSMFQYAALAKVLERKNEFDIIHFSCAQWYAPFILNQNVDKSIVTTVHINNLKEKPLKYVLDNFKKTRLVNISNFSSKPFLSYKNRETVYNGIDLSYFPFQTKPENYYGWLGRIAPAKGLKEGLLAAKKADVEFVACGPRDFEEYCQKEIESLVDEKRRLRDPLGLKVKGRFLSDAKAVLLPIQWEESFGLVAIESMACGTPVISFAKGAIPEIVVDGVTGFIVNPSDEDKRGEFIIKKTGVEGLTEAIQKLNSLSAEEYVEMRKNCRKRVEENFSVKKMAEGYEKVYKRMLDSI